jgi:hypothetical protein
MNNELLLDRVFAASIATVEAAGPLPESIEGMPEYTRNWFQLMRCFDPRLEATSDDELHSLFREVMLVE